jgi:hypothetical protein
MDIGKSFTYMFEDQEWIKKLLIGGVVNLIPIVDFAATGYWLTQTKNVYEGRDLPLPEWDNFGAYFMKGLMAFVGQLIYSLPIFLIYCCAFLLPTFAIGASANENQAGTLAGLVTALTACGGCLMFLYGLALVVFLPALLTRYALTEQFGALFQFREAWQLINANVGNYAIAVVMMIVAFAIAGFVGGLVCGIGAAFTSFWAMLVGAYLFGNVAKGTPQAAPAVA